jgi:hypothetical protein
MNGFALKIIMTRLLVFPLTFLMNANIYDESSHAMPCAGTHRFFFSLLSSARKISRGIMRDFTIRSKSLFQVKNIKHP